MNHIVALLESVNPDDTLDEHAEKIRDGIRELQTQMCNALHLALMVGKRLSLVKDQVAHGEWNQWLKDNCATKPRTAKLYIQLADHRGVIDDKIAEDPTLSIRAARRLIAKPIKPAAEHSNTADDPDAEAATGDAEQLMPVWRAASVAERKRVLTTLTIPALLELLSTEQIAELEQRAEGSLKAGCATPKQRKAIEQARRNKKKKKAPPKYLEATAPHLN